jgi:hypothetical protein
LVILAHDALRGTYRHAEAPIAAPAEAADPDDRTPPSPPGAPQGRALSSDSVVLSWSPSTDGDRWVPAAVGPPVARYAVYRNGMEIGSVTSTSLRDEPRTDATTQSLTIEYEIRAIDAAGNRSDPARVVVTLPATPGRLPALIGMAILGLAGLAAVYHVHRLYRARRRISSGPAPVPAEGRVPVSSDSGGRGR